MPDELIRTLYSLHEASNTRLFDRSRLVIKPLAERGTICTLDHWLALDDRRSAFAHPESAVIAARLAAARAQPAPPAS